MWGFWCWCAIENGKWQSPILFVLQSIQSTPSVNLLIVTVIKLDLFIRWSTFRNEHVFWCANKISAICSKWTDAMLKFNFHLKVPDQNEFVFRLVFAFLLFPFLFRYCALISLLTLTVSHSGCPSIYYVMRRVNHCWQLIRHAKLIVRILCSPFVVKICWFKIYFTNNSKY